MVNPFLLHPSKLQQSWRDLRKALAPDLPHDRQLDMVRSWWNMAPLSRPFLDYSNPSTWPDPWELLDSGQFDQNTIGLGMYYTLIFASDNRWKSSVKLAMLRDFYHSREALACVIHDKWLLGLDMEKLLDIDSENDLTAMHGYNYDINTRRIVELKDWNLKSVPLL